MTEEEWLACTDATPMIMFLRDKISDRKLRLFACACCRRICHLMVHAVSRRCVEVAEQYADGLAQEKELQAARHTAETELANTWHGLLACWYQAWAAAAAEYACFLDNPNESVKESWWNTCQVAEQAAQAVADEKAYVGSPYMTFSEAPWPDERQYQVALLRDLAGNPFQSVTTDPASLTANVVSIAQAIYDERAFDRLPILADALEDAGCTNQDILSHSRAGGDHVRGCWVVDLLLGSR